MSRPKKIGLDYFPVDVQFDRKIEAIESLFGNDGLVWVLKFWQQAYQTEFGELNLSGLFGELLAKNCRITTEQQEKIISASLEIDLIKKTTEGLYTSNGILKRMAAVSSERKSAIERKNKRKKEEKSKVKESKTSPDCSPNNLENTKPLNNKKILKPPNIEEVKKYFFENKYPELLAERFYKGYSEANWRDSHGNPVKNWKQKAQHVWFKPESKIQQSETVHPYEQR